MHLSRTLAAAAAVLASLTTFTAAPANAAAAAAPAAAAPTSSQLLEQTRAQVAGRVLRQTVSAVATFTVRHDGTLPSPVLGNGLAHQAALNATGAQVAARYMVTPARSAYCVAVHASGTRAAQTWLYDSTLDISFQGSPYSPAAIGGACRIIANVLERAAGREASAVADAHSAALNVESSIFQSGALYPATRAAALTQIGALSPGDTLAVYRRLPSTKYQRSAFRLCVVNVHGAWAAYDSRRGLVAAGLFGQRCAFPLSR